MREGAGIPHTHGLPPAHRTTVASASSRSRLPSFHHTPRRCPSGGKRRLSRGRGSGGRLVPGVPPAPLRLAAVVPAECECIDISLRICVHAPGRVPEGRDLELIGTASGRFATRSPGDSPGGWREEPSKPASSPLAAAAGDSGCQLPPGVGCLKLRARRTEARNGFPGKYRSTSFLLPY